MGQRLFYSKCRPQKCDAWPIAERARMAFVGYPVAVAEANVNEWRAVGCRAVLRDLASDAWDHSWIAHLGRGYRSQVSATRKIARMIGEGSIVLVPRPSTGVCYAGEVSGPFQLVDRPEWADQYFELRRASKLDMSRESDHIGDIVQGWPVREWARVRFTAIPRWISYRLLSRNTLGIVEYLCEPRSSAHDSIADLMRSEQVYAPPSTTQLERALLDVLTPSAFEHLIVSLLQLEAPAGTRWHHMGGSGDGGVDGIGTDSAGQLHGLVQCKWYYSDSPSRLLRSMDSSAAQRVVAILHGSQSVDRELDQDELFWNRRAIAELVLKHQDRLPLAGAVGLW